MDSLNDTLKTETSLDISYQELFDAIENNEIDELLQNKLIEQIEHLTPEQIDTWEATFRSELEEFKDKIKELRDGLKNEEPVGDYEITKNEEALIACEEVLDQIKVLKDEVKANLKTLEMTYHTMSEDAAISLSDYTLTSDPVQEVHMSTVSDAETLSEDFELTDYDGDGFITGRDYEAQKKAGIAEERSKQHDLFITMGDDFELVSEEHDDAGFTLLSFRNQTTGQVINIHLEGQISINLEGLLKNIPERLYANLPQGVLENLYVGDGSGDSGLLSVWDELHPLSMDEKVEMTQGYEETLNNLDVITQYLSADVDAAYVKTLAEDSLKLLFEILNSTDELVTNASQWAKVQSLLSQETPENAAATIAMINYALAVGGGDKLYPTLLNTNVCENIINRKETLNALDFATIAMMEMDAGAGLYGGQGLLTLGDAATVFIKTSANEAFGSVHADWANLPVVLEGLQLCQEMMLTTALPKFDAALQNVIKPLSDKIALNEQELAVVFSDDLYNEVLGAQGYHSSEKKGVLELTERWAESYSVTGDGIKDGEMTFGVDAIMTMILSNYNPDSPPSLGQVSASIQTAVSSLLQGDPDLDVGDILASWLFVMSEKAPHFLLSLFLVDPSLTSFITQYLAVEEDRTELINWASTYVQQISAQAQGIRNDLDVSTNQVEETEEEPADV